MSAMHSSPKLTRRALCTHTEVNQMGKPRVSSTNGWAAAKEKGQPSGDMPRQYGGMLCQG